jgi:hypothetical protein
MGDAILAFFGAPTAHEDDPLRAVYAGLDILQGIQPFREQISSEFDLDFNVRVGINTGVVVVGEMGSAQAGEYTAMGDAVNLATRMEQSASPGSIQITGETFRFVSPWIEVESLGGIEVKGKSELVPVYNVLGRKKKPTNARGIAGIRSPQSNFAAGVVATQMIQSWLFAMLGDLENAKQYQDQIKDFVAQYESFRPLFYVNQAQNELYAGEYEKALEIFDQVGLEYSTYSELFFHPYIYTLYIEIHLANKNFQLALETVDR